MNFVQSVSLCHGHAAPSGIEVHVIRARLETLCQRERQIAEGLVAGKVSKRIASELSLSPRTVEVYRANIMARMGAEHLSHLIRMMIAVERMPDDQGLQLYSL